MQNKKKEKEHFDEFTIDKPWNAFTEKSHNKIVKIFIDYLSLGKNDKIIDMGCGTGELTKKIKDTNFNNISGFDISENCIKKAKQQFKGIRFQVKDIEKTRLKKSSIDALFYCGILHHFEDLSEVVNEAHRVLKKGGKIFIFEPNNLNPVLWLFRNKKSYFRSKKLFSPNENFLSINQIKRSFEKGKFKVVRIGCISGISYTKEHFKKLFPFKLYYLVYAYNLFDKLLNATFLRKKHGSFIVGYIRKY